MKLGIKAKRNIGLIVTTVLLIVAIVLIVYFVQKNELDGRIKTGAIGDIVSTAQAEVHVSDMKISDEFTVGDTVYTAHDGKVFMTVYVEVTAKKKLTLYSGDFEIKDGVNVTNEYSSPNGNSFCAEEAQTVLKKGERKTFTLRYEVDEGRTQSYFLCALGAKIDLGGSVRVR